MTRASDGVTTMLASGCYREKRSNALKPIALYPNYPKIFSAINLAGNSKPAII